MTFFQVRHLLSNLVPQVAYLSLAYTMDAGEALLNPVGVPWEIAA
jgi:hypothetical protein